MAVRAAIRLVGAERGEAVRRGTPGPWSRIARWLGRPRAAGVLAAAPVGRPAQGSPDADPRAPIRFVVDPRDIYLA